MLQILKKLKLREEIHSHRLDVLVEVFQALLKVKIADMGAEFPETTELGPLVQLHEEWRVGNDLPEC